MAAPQNFRSAFNGFNREDVVHYLEYINAKHNNQLNQLTAENQELRAAAQHPVEDHSTLVESLQAQCAELTAQLEAEKAANAELTGKLEALQARCTELEQAAVPAVSVADTMSALASEELETYRRAERIEREAKERADLVYYQANGVLSEATAKVEGISLDITDMADQVMRQLTQLQIAVSSSKQALQDATSIMNTIRPNK